MDGWKWMIRGMMCVVGLYAGAFGASGVAYDTAWTFVYDGGLDSRGRVIPDNLRDVKVLPNGDVVCVGETRDSAFLQNVLLLKLGPDGKVGQKELYTYLQGAGAASLAIARNGDYVVGGYRSTSPLLLRLDPSLNVKSAAWYYDSVQNRLILPQSAIINSVLESEDGMIQAVAGEAFPEINGSYAAYLMFDSMSVQKRVNQWRNVAGYEITGWSMAAGQTGGYMLGGNQALFFIDAAGTLVSKNQYGLNVPGAGSQSNNVSKVRKLKSGALVVAGQSYEEDSFTRYGRLYYDAWWSLLSSSAGDDFRNVAGMPGAHDYLYDLAQLEGGQIAFVGAKGTPQDSGIWVFVTDSTARNILWQKQYNLPGLDQGSPRNNILPISIAATPDSGFIVVGQEGARLQNNNACAFKFKPSQSLPVAGRPAFREGRPGAGRVFSFQAVKPGTAMLRFFDVKGRPAADYRIDMRRAGPAEFKVDPSRFARGVHLWRFEAAGRAQQGKIIF